LRRIVNNNSYATYKLQLTGRGFYPKSSPKRKQKNRILRFFSRPCSWKLAQGVTGLDSPALHSARANSSLSLGGFYSTPNCV